jgi:hypothetical protein
MPDGHRNTHRHAGHPEMIVGGHQVAGKVQQDPDKHGSRAEPERTFLHPQRTVPPAFGQQSRRVLRKNSDAMAPRRGSAAAARA